MKEFAGKKGALSAIVEKGIDLADEETKRNWAHDRILEIAKSSTWKGDGKFKREEVYDRKIFG